MTSSITAQIAEVDLRISLMEDVLATLDQLQQQQRGGA
jgi:hypothetical protein